MGDGGNMRIIWSLLFLFVCVAICSPQNRNDSSGKTLLESCQLTMRRDLADSNASIVNLENVVDAYRDGLCTGLVRGVSDVSPKVCSHGGRPGDVTYSLELAAVIKYLQDHPKEFNLKATTLVEKALSNAFPCTKPH